MAILDRLRPSKTTESAAPSASSHASHASQGPLHEKHAKPRDSADAEARRTGEGEAWVDPYGPAPGFKNWFKLYWHDVAAFIFLAAIALWLLKWSPVPYKKYFTVVQDPSDASSDVVDPMFAHPKRSQYMPIIADAMVAVFVPIITIWIINFFGIAVHSRPGQLIKRPMRFGSFLLGRGSFWNVNNGCMGVIYAIMTGATIQIIVKLVVPGLRPHFLTVCDPQIDSSTQGEGYRGLYFTTSICRDAANREDEIANALQSFPSGHSVAAWAGLGYLSLYLNAHLKVFANYHASYWKFLVFVAPLVAATLIVGSLTLDMSHNWYDVVVGSIIGAVMAILAYRMCFAAVWDFRWNHVPLRRGLVKARAHGVEQDVGQQAGFAYSAEEMRAWAGCVATRRAGWGIAGGQVIGAPGDSTAFFVGPVDAMFSSHHGEQRHGHGHGHGPTHEVNGTSAVV